MLSNKQNILPVSVLCNGEYGYNDISLSLPAVIGEKGIVRIPEIALDSEDQSLLDICADKMSEIVRQLD